MEDNGQVHPSPKNLDQKGLQKHISDFYSSRTARCDIRFPSVLRETDTIVEVLVPSRSVPDVFYTVVYDRVSRKICCDCKGFSFKGDCSHIHALEFQSYKSARRKKKDGTVGVQDTSIMAYKQVEESRKTQEMLVYHVLRDRGPLSIGQLSEFIGLPPGRISARLNALRFEYDPPLVCDVGKSHVGHNGKLVYLWSVV